jgi:predicted alpha/beta-fold hydrolase
VLEYAMREYPAATVLAAGWSLGANILLCYLGEEGSRTPVRAAVSLCNPFDLVASDENFQKGFNRVYDKKLAKTLKGLLEKNQEVFISEGHRKGIDVAKAISSKSIRDFDEFLTTKSFGKHKLRINS